MIRTIKDEETRKIFQRQVSLKLLIDIQRVALRKLRMLDNAENLNDLRVPPGNHLEKLSGERVGQYSIRINDRWRICFEWTDDNAYDVEIIDYH